MTPTSPQPPQPLLWQGCRLSDVRATLADPLLADGALRNAEEVKGSLVVILRGVVPFVEK
eukprot:COSAG01_NODE_10941_length_2043_cov_1.408436_2_plen_60_part_00